MKHIVGYVVFGGCFLVFLLSFLLPEMYAGLSLFLTLLVTFSIIYKLGRGIVLRELICLHGCVFCLLMPWVGYQWYGEFNALSKLWVTYMPVGPELYYGFTLPAMAGFTTAMCLPINRKGISDEGEYMDKYLKNIKSRLNNYPNLGLYLAVIGIFFLYLEPLLPESLQYPANLLYTGSYTGILLIYFNDHLKYRRLALVLFLLFIMGKALSGMFTEIAYLSVTICSFFFIGKRIAFWKKLLVFAIGIICIVLLQSVKVTYREKVWKNGYGGNRAMLMAEIAADKVTNASSLIDQKAFFPVYARFNQGFNIGMVMRRFPAVKPFDDGSQLFFNLASAFVPRFLWPDKPLAGGRFNMKYYAGFNIFNWSTNVGPVGEAYGSFGRGGGIIFMIVLGFFVRWAYSRLFMLSRTAPLAIFWLPLLFYQVTYSLEADTLQIMNSLLKSSFLLFIVYKIYPPLLGNPAKRKQPAIRLNYN